MHLASVHDGEGWRLYRNAKEVASLETDLGAVKVHEDWAIGAHPSRGIRHFDIVSVARRDGSGLQHRFDSIQPLVAQSVLVLVILTDAPRLMASVLAKARSPERVLMAEVRRLFAVLLEN